MKATALGLLEQIRQAACRSEGDKVESIALSFPFLLYYIDCTPRIQPRNKVHIFRLLTTDHLILSSKKM